MIIEDEKRNRVSIGETAITDPEYSRRSKYFKYLICDVGNKDKVIKINSRIYFNAAHCAFYKEIYDFEVGNDSTSMQSLLELRGYDYIQAYNHGRWQDVDDAEFDIKFLARKYDLFDLTVLPRHIEKEELKIVEEIIEEIGFQKEISNMTNSERAEIKELFKKLMSSKIHK